MRGNKCKGKGVEEEKEEEEEEEEEGVRTKMKRDRKKRKGRCRAAVNKPSSLSNVSPETEKSTRVSWSRWPLEHVSVTVAALSASLEA